MHAHREFERRLRAFAVGLVLCAAAAVQAQPAPADCRSHGADGNAGLRHQCLVMRDGQRLWVGRAGAPGRPMALLVHGLGQNAHTDWQHTVPALAERYQVITLDLPGFGGSPARSDLPQDFPRLAALLAELIERLAPNGRADVLGHSLGASLSLHLADQYPERVNRLVLVSAAGVLYKPVYLQALATWRPPSTGFAPADGLLGFLAERANGLSSLLLLGHDQRADLGPWLQRNPAIRQLLVGNHPQTGAALALAEHDFTPALRRMKRPAVLVWGRRDPIAPLRTGQVLADRMVQAQLHVMEGVGHTPMVESPAAFNRLLLAALDREPEREDLGTLADQPSQGHVVCRESHGRVYTGRFDSLTLQRCSGVRIERAVIGQLDVQASTVQLLQVHVRGDDVALRARDSEVTATASRFVGRVAIETDNSWFDLAGVLVQASGPGLRQIGVKSRLFLSLSDWQASDWQGDAHGVWPLAPR